MENHLRHGRLEARTIGLILVFGFLSRVPFVGPGFGSDPDAWRVANSARRLAETGVYVPSRMPSYPLHEFTSAALYKIHPSMMVWASVAFAALAGVVLAAILANLGFRNYLPLSIAFLSAPVTLVCSTMAMDYVWGVCFLLTAVYFASTRRLALSAISTGLLVASRPSSVVLLPILIAYAVWNRGKDEWAKAVIGFIAVSIGVAGLFFFPVYLKYGFSYFGYYPGKTDRISMFLRSSDCFGNVGLLVLVGSLVVSAVTVWRQRESNTRGAVASFMSASIAIVVVVLIVFARFPYEIAYLLPAIPFLIALAGFNKSELLAWILAASLLAGNFVDINMHLKPTRGWMIRELDIRERQVDRASLIATRIARLEGNALVVCGSIQPWVTYMLGTHTPQANKVVYGISKEMLDKINAKERRLWYLAGIDKWNKEVYGVDLAELGANQLDLR